MTNTVLDKLITPPTPKRVKRITVRLTDATYAILEQIAALGAGTPTGIGEQVLQDALEGLGKVLAAEQRAGRMNLWTPEQFREEEGAKTV